MDKVIDFKKDLEPLMREAGKIMLSAHDQESEEKMHIKPGTANFVTEYDVAIQTFLLENIKKMYPEAEFIAEEDEKGENAEFLKKDMCFIIDPIDGTTNFVHDYRSSVISVGIVSHGKTVWGGAYHPYLNEFCYAGLGKGAYMNGRRICVSERTLDMSIASIGTAVYYKDDIGKKTMDLTRDLYFSCVDIRRSGAAVIDFVNLACGRTDLFIEYLLQPWDIAAGALIVSEAGGIVTDVFGNNIDLSAPSSVVAGTPITYPAARNMAAKYM